MKTIEIKLYKFEELSDDAKEFAIKDNYLINVDMGMDWWEPTYDTFWNQFGIAINSFDLYRHEIDIDFRYDLEKVCYRIIEDMNGNSLTEICSDYLDSLEKINDATPKWERENSRIYEDDIQQLDSLFIKDLKNEILGWLSGEHDYLTSEDAIIETLTEGDYDFTEKGELY